MKTLNLHMMATVKGGSSDCLKSMVVMSVAGSFFGGIGSFVGATIAASGPDCLDLW